MKSLVKSRVLTIAASVTVSLAVFVAVAPGMASADTITLGASNGGSLYACKTSATSAKVMLRAGNATSSANPNGVNMSVSAGGLTSRTIYGSYISGSVSFRPGTGGGFAASTGKLPYCSN